MQVLGVQVVAAVQVPVVHAAWEVTEQPPLAAQHWPWGGGHAVEQVTPVVQVLVPVQAAWVVTLQVRRSALQQRPMAVPLMLRMKLPRFAPGGVKIVGYPATRTQ